MLGSNFAAARQMNHSTDKSPRRQQRQGRQPTRLATNARANYERYSALARESVQVGDTVQTEN
jgi:hypothetical protein